tara:strand:+ start:169 stop:543 length:375 start_codon:yes stop_codon:yes gene_type:complete
VIDSLSNGKIHIRGLRLWAHVGVLDQEKLLGQWFDVEFAIWAPLDIAAKNDDIKSTLDYSIAIKALQRLSERIKCSTIEYFSEEILNCLEDVYGPLPMKVILRKCYPPIPGFTGDVGIERSRNI